MLIALPNDSSPLPFLIALPALIAVTVYTFDINTELLLLFGDITLD